jgi:hypothetical protein
MISVDSEHHNQVIWKKQEGINAYNIYREGNIAGKYELVATADSNNPNRWIDTESNARIRSYRYKVSGTEACDGKEYGLSSPHKTMHLTISQGVGGSWNLIWTPYEGTGYSTYHIYRAIGETLGELKLIASMPSSNTSYTDFVDADSYIYYVVEIVPAEACKLSATRSANAETSINSIRSNFGTNNPKGVTTGLNNINAENSVQIYPNPVKNELKIDNGQLTIKNVEIFDIYGRKQLSMVDYQLSSIQIDVTQLLPGIYFVKIETEKETVTKKFVKE